MELQKFVIVSGDAFDARAGDTITIKGVFNPSTATAKERLGLRIGRAAQLISRMPNSFRWRLYILAQRVANALEPDV
jgi:hypothetical protein